MEGNGRDRQSASPRERATLRELAKRVRAVAELPVMADRRRLWLAHNSGQSRVPPVVMELGGFHDEFMRPHPCVCEHPLAREIEGRLRLILANHERVDDDKVVSPWYDVFLPVGLKIFDTDFEVRQAKDADGRALSYTQVNHPVTDIGRDLPALPRSTFHVNRAAAREKMQAAADWMGDILPPRLKNNSLTWAFSLSNYAIQAMGDEPLMVAMAEEPDHVRLLYARIRDELLAYLDWQEREGLLTLNNDNDYAGAGSYGFTAELPRPDLAGPVRVQDLWGNLNSQETTCVSPAMFADLAFPAYRDVAERFGLVYYGCCEPVHDLWEPCLSKLTRLRKVSVSAWCDERRMGDYLRGGPVIYSRKPSPNYIGIGAFDERAFRAHIAATLDATQGCPLEFIFRDIYTLKGDGARAGRAVKIVRELIADKRD